MYNQIDKVIMNYIRTITYRYFKICDKSRAKISDFTDVNVKARL